MHLKPMGTQGKCPKHVRAWTAQEDALLVNLYSSMTTTEIAPRLGRSIGATRERVRVLRQAGRLPYKCHYFTQEEDAFIRANRHRLSASDMAERLGRKQGDIQKRASSLGISLRKYGDFHHCTKYPDDDVELIRQLRDEFGLTFKEIAEKFETSLQHANFIYHKRLTATDAIAREYLPR